MPLIERNNNINKAYSPCGLNAVSPQNSYVATLNPQCGGIWRLGLQEVISVRLLHKNRALMKRLVALQDKDRKERPYEHIGRWQPSASQRVLTRTHNAVTLILDFQQLEL